MNHKHYDLYNGTTTSSIIVDDIETEKQDSKRVIQSFIVDTVKDLKFPLISTLFQQEIDHHGKIFRRRLASRSRRPAATSAASSSKRCSQLHSRTLPGHPVHSQSGTNQRQTPRSYLPSEMEVQKLSGSHLRGVRSLQRPICQSFHVWCLPCQIVRTIRRLRQAIVSSAKVRRMWQSGVPQLHVGAHGKRGWLWNGKLL